MSTPKNGDPESRIHCFFVFLASTLPFELVFISNASEDDATTDAVESRTADQSRGGFSLMYEQKDC